MSIRERAYHTEEHYAVLILVLMEDALRGFQHYAEAVEDY